jgi:N-acetyl-anhydromuramyl-L-alanine amidase AmpD
METYKLSNNNYVEEKTNKKRIIIGNTFSYDMNHVKGWETRYNGSYKKTAHYTISVDGTIYEHFSPDYYSKLMLNEKVNKTSIIILLENIGWLIESNLKEKEYIDYTGNMYNQSNVFEKKWRGYKYWSEYTREQEESTIKLVKELCTKYKIPLNVIAHNTNVNDANKFEGILYKSNFEKFYTDVNPTWNFEQFKNNIELKLK